jgi:hypothetical protein
MGLNEEYKKGFVDGFLATGEDFNGQGGCYKGYNWNNGWNDKKLIDLILENIEDLRRD